MDEKERKTRALIREFDEAAEDLIYETWLEIYETWLESFGDPNKGE